MRRMPAMPEVFKGARIRIKRMESGGGIARDGLRLLTV